MNEIEQALSRHEKVALQFSGGRDSLALVYLMRPYWDRITVYHVNAGAPFPETVASVEHVRALVPNFVYVMGRQPEVIAQHGMPSDIVPANHTELGLYIAGDGVLIQDRYSCCARSIMAPLHERMQADGVTLILRGQRNVERLKSRLRSGNVEGGFELLMPIEDWSDDDVMTYLREQGAPIPAFYEMMQTSHECTNCTAYLELGMNKYLKARHPELWQANQQRLALIYNALLEPVANFNSEFEMTTTEESSDVRH